jgi:PAS domain S-box-containing protein
MAVGDFFSKGTPAAPEPPRRDEDSSLAFLGSIVESSEDAIVGLSLGGNIIAWNAAAARIFEYDQLEVVGQPISILIPLELQGEALSILDKVRRGERMAHFETTRVKKGGRRIGVSLTISPVRDASGIVFGISEVARDIEAQKRIERASAQLAAIVESSDDAIVSKSLDGVIQTWNAGAQRIFGYAPEEMIGQNILKIIPPDLQDEERTIIRRIRAGERIEHFDTVRIAKDGRRIPISLTVSPIRDARGAIIGASKVARDISERQRSERELRESRHKLAAEAAELARLSVASSRLWASQTLAAGLDEILRTARTLTGAEKGNIQLLNPARNTLSIVGFEGFDAAFLATFEHIAADDRRAACGRALESGEAVIIEDVLADEAYAPFHDVARKAGYRAVVSVPFFAANGSRLGAISVHFPSPHRPSQAEMRRLLVYCRQASDFIQRIRLEHTLRQREEDLQEADRRKNEFLAILAHELRNPLAPIRYALGITRKAAVSIEQKAHAQEILERQAAIMSRLLDDLLDISRITRGALELKKASTKLAPIIETAIEAARPYVVAKQHELSVSLPDRPVWLEADPVRLAQVFSNLLINSAKYTDPGGRIELEAASSDEGVIVTVRDNGIGIAAEMMPRLFSLFSQSPTVAGRAGEGLGVGLAMARGLVNLHGGAIEARSAGMGRGSEFLVRLPIGDADYETDDVQRFEQRPPKQSLRVLVVDDNRDAADSCATLLELSGHRVQIAYNGTRALQLGETFLPHIVLLDIGLPDINGYEVARRIRASEWGNHLPLAAVTGWGKEEDRQRAIEAGFDHHLTKPVAPESVESLVRSLADKLAPA